MESTDPISAEALAQHGRFVRALAQSLLADPHLADDVAQEALLRYVERPPRSALDPRGWFRRVVGNLARDARRAEERRRARENAAARSPTVSHDDAQASVLRSVVEAVTALDEPYRSTVLARYFRGWEPARIASESATPIATVKSRLQRAHALLRERLDREHGARRNWAPALATLADLGGSAAKAGAGLSTLASGAKLGGLAALIALAAFVAWRLVQAHESETHSLVGDASASTREVALAPPAASAGGERESAPAANELGAPQTFRVAGSILDLAYAPLALAAGPARDLELEVQLVTGDDWNARELVRATQRTDANGAFSVELENPSVRPFTLVLGVRESAERRGVHLHERIDANVLSREGIELVRAAHGLLEGSVVDAAGRPLPHARLRVHARSGRTPGAEIESGEGGELRVPWPGDITTVESRDSGSVVMSFEPAVLSESGGAAGLKVVMARSAALRVRVVDERGAAVSGAHVTVDLDESERRTLGRERDWNEPEQKGETGPDGTLEFPSVWADSKLKLSLVCNADAAESTSVRGSELVFAPPLASAAPIVLAPGSQRELVARTARELVVSGRTLSTKGDGLADVQIEVLRASEWGDGYELLARFKSGAGGLFEQRLQPLRIQGPLRLVAKEHASPEARLEGLGYVGGGGPSDGALGIAELDPNAVVDGQLRAEIVLAPTLSIAGRLLDADGNAVTRESLGGCRLWATPAGAGCSDASELGSEPGAKIAPDGTFRVFGLTRGEWDVYVSKQIASFYSWDSFVHRFPAILAGTEGLELRLERLGDVHVRLRLHGGAPESVTVLHGRLFPSELSLPEVRAPRAMHVADTEHWPLGATLGFSGISGGRDELGRWSYGFYETDEVAQHDLQSMGPGWYVFGVHASSRDGSRSWCPQASEPRYFEAGDYLIDFDLVATTTVSGRVLASADTEHLAVELRTPSGARVPLESMPGYARPRFALETDARGGFVIRHAPVGVYELRAGTLEQLERGEFGRALALEISAESNAPLELRW